LKREPESGKRCAVKTRGTACTAVAPGGPAKRHQIRKQRRSNRGRRFRKQLKECLLRHASFSYLGPNFSKHLLAPCSSHSAFVIHISSLSAMILASTAPPRNTICLLLGGSSIRTLNLLNLSGFPPRTFVSHNCLSSFSNREGRPGYMELPPDKTMALKSEARTSTSAA
jgi:hypothetical protein